jgi:acyl-coenzyme A thioesterase PaaI-like protein
MNETRFEARNPDYEAITRDGLSRHGLMAHLGVEMATVEPGFVELRADYRPELTQQHGYFHGGLMGAMADTACGYAAFSLTPPGEGERLIARGWVKRPGRTLIVTHGDVFVIKDDIETLCATMLQTIMVLPESESRPAG